MSVEQKIKSSNLTKEFLSAPFEQLKIRELANPPDIELLQWLPTLEEEAGLSLRHGRWFMIKASKLGIPSWLIPVDADVFLHSHTIGDDEKDDGSIPGLRDLLNCLPTTKNFIASQKGITRYWPVLTRDGQRQLERTIEERGGFEKGQRQECLQFLEEIGAEFVVDLWKELNEEKWAQLLEPPRKTPPRDQ